MNTPVIKSRFVVIEHNGSYLRSVRHDLGGALAWTDSISGAWHLDADTFMPPNQLQKLPHEHANLRDIKTLPHDAKFVMVDASYQARKPMPVTTITFGLIQGELILGGLDMLSDKLRPSPALEEIRSNVREELIRMRDRG